MVSINYISASGNRRVNEDAVGYTQKDGKYCFILCDGLGGHGSGDVASAAVKDTFLEIFEKSDLAYEDFFSTAYREANTKILGLQKSDPQARSMKTTAVSLVIADGECMWTHIGDSRLYCFGKDSVISRTLDHSVPQMLVASKEISEKEIRFHPDRNKLLRALGVDDEMPRYDKSSVTDLKQCRAFLLCSDGFWELISEKRMCHMLKKSKSAKEWLRLMTKRVRKCGRNKNMDNYSAIAIIIKD